MSINFHAVVNDYRSAGYKVRVRHCRYVPIFNDCFTRAEFNDEHNCWDRPEDFGNYVSNYFGFTQVILESPDGKVFTGKHNFGIGKTFNKRVGRVSALGKALAKIR